MYDELSMIYEGIYDPAIYKAIFVIGGPGSGKSFVTRKLGLANFGFVQINSDYPFEKYMRREGLNFKMPPEEKEQRDKVRQGSKRVMASKEEMAIFQGLGLYIDGTGAKKDNILSMDQKLKMLGYDTAMVLVNTDIGTAIARNKKRERSVPDYILKDRWSGVQQNIGFYQNHFDKFFIIDNSKGSEFEGQIQRVYKKIMKWIKTPVNKNAQSKVAKEVQDRGITNYKY